MAKIALLFPGQGAQAVGMGQDLYETFPAARQIIDQFTEWTHPNLKEVIFQGPEETLKRTLYTQPAILAVSLAAYTVFNNHLAIQPVLAAGHSLGEYGALYAAGVIDLETAAKLIKRRAELMESAPAGAMAAVLGLEQAKVEEAVQAVQTGTVVIANYNTPEQHILSGEPEAVQAAGENAKAFGASKVIPLVVGGAFHSPLMQEAAQAFAHFVKDFAFHNPAFPVITNVDAQLTTQGPACQDKLAQQIASSVRWSQTISQMNQAGIDTFIELGPGKVLTGMMKRLCKDARLFNISDSASLQQTLAGLEERIAVS